MANIGNGLTPSAGYDRTALVNGSVPRVSFVCPSTFPLVGSTRGFPLIADRFDGSGAMANSHGKTSVCKDDTLHIIVYSYGHSIPLAVKIKIILPSWYRPNHLPVFNCRCTIFASTRLQPCGLSTVFFSRATYVHCAKFGFVVCSPKWKRTFSFRFVFFLPRFDSSFLFHVAAVIRSCWCRTSLMTAHACHTNLGELRLQLTDSLHYSIQYFATINSIQKEIASNTITITTLLHLRVVSLFFFDVIRVFALEHNTMLLLLYVAVVGDFDFK